MMNRKLTLYADNKVSDDVILRKKNFLSVTSFFGNKNYGIIF